MTRIFSRVGQLSGRTGQLVCQGLQGGHNLQRGSILWENKTSSVSRGERLDIICQFWTIGWEDMPSFVSGEASRDKIYRVEQLVGKMEVRGR